LAGPMNPFNPEQLKAESSKFKFHVAPLTGRIVPRNQIWDEG
jgi:hypothetical protein